MTYRIPSCEERQAIYKDVLNKLNDDTQTIPRVITRMLRAADEWIIGLASYIKNPAHACALENGGLRFYIWKENAVWGSPCHYEIDLLDDGKELIVRFPVNVVSLRHAFGLTTFAMLECYAPVACKMYNNSSDRYAVRYEPTLHAFEFTLRNKDA